MALLADAADALYLPHAFQLPYGRRDVERVGRRAEHDDAGDVGGGDGPVDHYHSRRIHPQLEVALHGLRVQVQHDVGSPLRELVRKRAIPGGMVLRRVSVRAATTCKSTWDEAAANDANDGGQEALRGVVDHDSNLGHLLERVGAGDPFGDRA